MFMSGTVYQMNAHVHMNLYRRLVGLMLSTTAARHGDMSYSSWSSQASPQ